MFKNIYDPNYKDEVKPEVIEEVKQEIPKEVVSDVVEEKVENNIDNKDKVLNKWDFVIPAIVIASFWFYSLFADINSDGRGYVPMSVIMLYLVPVFAIFYLIKAIVVTSIKKEAKYFFGNFGYGILLCLITLTSCFVEMGIVENIKR